ncbi:MAG: hypothetical protein C0467_27940 [Planctomycetaceae bacterium]|nr:hypothetical protein [Planctomycetaceae bacterium]
MVANASSLTCQENLKQWGGFLHGLAHRYARSADSAEDAYQEIAARALKHFRSYNPELAAFSTWLAVVARSLDSEMRDRRSRTISACSLSSAGTASGDGSPLADLIPDPHHIDPEGQIDARDQREAIRQAISRLPNEEREAIRMRYWGDSTLGSSERLSLTRGLATLNVSLARLREAGP